MLQTLDLQIVACDLFERKPELSRLLINILLNKGKGCTLMPKSFQSHSSLEIEYTEDYGVWLDLEDGDIYLFWTVLKMLDEISEEEYSETLQSLRRPFIESLVVDDSLFDRYLKKIRGNGLKKILDTRFNDISTSIIVANSVDLYHYIAVEDMEEPIEGQEQRNKYIEFCKDTRTEPIEIKEVSEDELNQTELKYDVVVLDSNLLEYTIYDYIEMVSDEEDGNAEKENTFNIIKTIKSLKYKKIFDFSDYTLYNSIDDIIAKFQ